MTVKALSQADSPVSSSDLAAWLRTDDTSDPMLSVCWSAATNAVIEFLKLDLLSRDRLLTLAEWPTKGTKTHGLGRSTIEYCDTVELPYTNLLNVDGIEVFGAITTDYEIMQGNPAKIRFTHTSIAYNDQDPAIVIQYQAGYGADSELVPEAIKIAITMLAGYVFMHRGSCDMTQAMEKSGAKMMLIPYANNIVVF